jgi:hypothetical protein
MPRTREELIAELETQLDFLRSSGAGFDAGNLMEAKRLATTVCVLVEDGRRNTRSVLTQLGTRHTLQFMSTARPLDPRNMLSESPLVIVRLGEGGGRYLPRFDNSIPTPKWLSFVDWWNDPIIRDKSRQTLSRRTLTRALRDQEGGSHFDENLSDPVYIGVAKENSMGWVITTAEGTRPLDPGPHLASMRQISWELEQSLQDLPEQLRNRDSAL